MKKKDGLPLSVQGSSQPIQTLLENRLVDELYVWTFPVQALVDWRLRRNAPH
ncbi:hypothetical protein [Sedimentitalea sp.]|uniref:hypothetical protein n=1 Tax=Sedimentitalea sp. TaxID=2048915 RepID=UPI003298D400